MFWSPVIIELACLKVRGGIKDRLVFDIQEWVAHPGSHLALPGEYQEIIAKLITKYPNLENVDIKHWKCFMNSLHHHG
jgi:hypothetical protein